MHLPGGELSGAPAQEGQELPPGGAGQVGQDVSSFLKVTSVRPRSIRD